MDCSAAQPNLAASECWVAPNSDYFGHPTTMRVWKDASTYIDTHTRYDQFGNAIAAQDPIGNETKTTFSSQYAYAYPTKVIAPAPNASSSTHGSSETSTVETSYDPTTGLPLTVTDDFGQITTTEYNDALLRPTKISPNVNSEPPGPVTITEYQDGPIDTQGGAIGGDRYVRVKKQLDATNWDESTTYMDSLGRPIKTQAKDSQGDVFVETHYDLLGRVDRVTNPYRTGDAILWNKTRYDAAGRAVETYAPATLSVVTAPSPSPTDLVSLGTTAYAISSVPDYIGTVVTTKDASGRRGRSFTNALGRLVRVDEPDSDGGLPPLPQTTASPEPTDPPPCHHCEFTGGDFPSNSTDYKYNAQGKLVEVVQGEQHRYFKYDSLGRLIRVRQPEQETNSSLHLSDAFNTSGDWTAGFTYDVLGNVLTATDANGTVITNTYDRAGRVITRSYSNTTTSGFATTPSVNFYYDGKGLAQQQSPNYAKGKLTKVDNGVSATEYMTFDNFGRLTRTRQITDGVVYGTDQAPMTFSYNLSGAMIEEHYPSGRVVKNEFESDGDLAKISSKKAGSPVYSPFATGFSYTPDGKIEKLRLGNNLWEAARFNNRLQVTELDLGHSVPTNTPGSGGDLWRLGYEYGELDANGEVIASTNTGNIGKQTLNVPGVTFTQRYHYDSLYRLTSAKETSGETVTWAQDFQYDRYGNRTRIDEAINGQRTERTTPGIDPLTNRFTDLTTFNYDKNGNIVRDIDAVTREPRIFVFNADNKQAEIKKLNEESIGKYYYDGEGKRVKKVVPSTGEATVFVYSSGKLVAEYSTAAPPANPSINYTATDMLGSPRVITNELGNVTSRRDFMPFGEDVPIAAGNRAAVEDILVIAEVDGTTGNLRTTALNYLSADGIRQRFTGYQKDTETSLDFAEARMYESRYGRFTAVDPLLASGKSANPQSFNRYVYVGNNPLIATDPSGLQMGWAIDKRDKSPTGENTPWVYFQYFEGTGSRETHNAANGHNFQPFDGKYYLYGDQKYAYLSGSTYHEGVYSGPADLWKGLVNMQEAGNTREVDAAMDNPSMEVFTKLTGSENNAVNAEQDRASPGQTPLRVQIGIVIPFCMAPEAAILNRGGTFAELNALKGVDEVAHHMPQNAFMRELGISRNDGFALGMTRAEHMLTRTYAGRGALTMRTDFSLGLTARQRLFMDVQQIRQTFGSRYNRGMLELIDRTKTNPFFQKPPVRCSRSILSSQ